MEGEAELMSEPGDEPLMLYHRDLGNGFEVCVYPLFFGEARLCFGRRHSGDIDRVFYYHQRDVAVAAAHGWAGEGDPAIGWYRDVHGRRWRDNGDPAKETVQP